MYVEIEGEIEGSLDATWDRIQGTAWIRGMLHPFMQLVPERPAELPARFEDERVYEVALWSLWVVPLGRQELISRTWADGDARTTQNEARGPVVRHWNHQVTVRPAGPGRVAYHDRIDVSAGPLTPVVALYTRALFAVRRRRWART